MARKKDLKIRPHAAHGKVDPKPADTPRPAALHPADPRPEEPRPADPVPLQRPAPDAAPRLEEVRPKRRRRRSLVWTVLSRLVLLGVLGVGGFLLWQHWDDLAPESFVVWIEDKLSGGGGGDGFPVDVAGRSVQHIAPLGDHIALLSDTAFTVLNDRGGELVRRPHMYSTPLMKTAGAYALLAESGGTRVSLETRSKTVWSKTLENAIVSAAVGRNGTAVVITQSSQGAIADLLAFDRKGRELYRRSLSSYVVDAAVSPAGDRIALISVGAAGGAMQSTLEVFTLQADESPVLSYTGADVMLCAVGVLGDGRIAAVGDTALWMADETTGTVVQKDYGGQQLLGYAFGENSAAVVSREYGATGGGRFLLVQEDGTAAYTVDFDGEFRDMAAREDGYVLLTGDALRAMDPTGAGAVQAVPADGLFVCPLGRQVLVVGLTAMQAYTLG